jgi:acetyl/propionyl-CoA carboxylase alpha subunit
MISKLIAWAPDRREAIARMVRALEEYELQGIHSTIPFLINVLNHQKFIQGNFTTNFIAEEKSLFRLDERKARVAALAAALLFEREKNKKKYQPGTDSGTSGWKNIKRKIYLDR